MPDEQPSQLGKIAWTDLTVPDAQKVRDFYEAVAGWRAEPLSMGDYDDYVMCAPGAAAGDGVAGVCHARGSNANLPPQWLIYITVPDVAAAVKQCVALGGAVVDGPREVGSRQFCVIRDPAGAVAGLIEP